MKTAIRTKTPVSAYASFGFRLNQALDAGRLRHLSFNEIFDAAADCRLISFLAERAADQIGFTWITEAHAGTLNQMETALRDAASAYEGRIGRATGPLSGACLVQTILFEAIQQQFRHPQAPRPADEPALPSRA